MNRHRDTHSTSLITKSLTAITSRVTRYARKTFNFKTARLAYSGARDWLPAIVPCGVEFILDVRNAVVDVGRMVRPPFCCDTVCLDRRIPLTNCIKS